MNNLKLLNLKRNKTLKLLNQNHLRDFQAQPKWFDRITNLKLFSGDIMVYYGGSILWFHNPVLQYVLAFSQVFNEEFVTYKYWISNVTTY